VHERGEGKTNKKKNKKKGEEGATLQYTMVYQQTAVNAPFS